MGTTKFPNGLEVGGVLIAAEGLAGLRLKPQTLTATGAMNEGTSALFLNHASTIIAATVPAPTAGDILVIANTSASGTAAHTVTLPEGVTWNGTNRIATLNAPSEALVCIGVSATRYLVLVNLGTVAFS